MTGRSGGLLHWDGLKRKLRIEVMTTKFHQVKMKAPTGKERGGKREGRKPHPEERESRREERSERVCGCEWKRSALVQESEWDCFNTRTPTAARNDERERRGRRRSRERREGGTRDRCSRWKGSDEGYWQV
jgi:hypothetical protein